MYCDDVPKLKVSLQVNNVDLEEHADDADDHYEPNRCERYVEATAGAEFVVSCWRGHQFLFPRDSIDVRVYLDGKYATGRVLPPTNVETRNVIDGVLACPTGVWTLERFRFAELLTVDGQPMKPSAADAERMKDLGTVKVTLTRCVSIGTEQRVEDHRFKAAAEKGIHEKMLKGRALSQQAALSKPEATACKGWAKTEYPYGKEPFATFTFKYRSRRDLQIEGIIPRDPTSVPLEERDPATLTPEEARELVRRLQAERVKIKREGVKAEKRTASQIIDSDDDDDDDLEVVESEASRRKRTRLSNDSGVEVVDLTDD